MYKYITDTIDNNGNVQHNEQNNRRTDTKHNLVKSVDTRFLADYGLTTIANMADQDEALLRDDKYFPKDNLIGKAKRSDK